MNIGAPLVLARARRGMCITAGVIMMLCAPTPGLLHADGGAVLLQRQAGAFHITVFASPVPLRAGPADFSVLLRDRLAPHSGDLPAVLDASVTLHLRLGNAAELVVPATHAAATNKLLYAANVILPQAGNWNLRVDVRRGASAANVSAIVPVAPGPAPLLYYWPYLAAPPLLVALFALNQWLRRRRELAGRAS